MSVVSFSPADTLFLTGAQYAAIIIELDVSSEMSGENGQLCFDFNSYRTQCVESEECGDPVCGVKVSVSSSVIIYVNILKDGRREHVSLLLRLQHLFSYE